MEAGNAAEDLSFARQALAKDPDCVDALVILANATARSQDDLIAGLERAVSTGERVLGAKYLKEYKGHFWGPIETRPYMRARSGLADVLLGAGRRAADLAHYQR